MEKLVTYRNKERFIERQNVLVGTRNLIMQFYNEIYLPLIDKYNGKVINARFIHELEGNREYKGRRFFISHEDKNYTIQKEIMIQFYNHDFKSSSDYNDYETLYCGLVLNAEGRLDKKLTMENAIVQAWVKNFEAETQTIKDSIESYDKDMKFAEEFAEMCKKFNNLSSNFRRNLGANQFRVYAGQ